MQIWANMEQRERKSEEGIACSSEMAPVYWFGKHHKPTSRSETPPSHSHPQQVRHMHTVQAGTCTGTHTNVQRARPIAVEWSHKLR